MYTVQLRRYLNGRDTRYTTDRYKIQQITVNADWLVVIEKKYVRRPNHETSISPYYKEKHIASWFGTFTVTLTVINELRDWLHSWSHQLVRMTEINDNLHRRAAAINVLSEAYSHVPSQQPTSECCTSNTQATLKPRLHVRQSMKQYLHVRSWYVRDAPKNRNSKCAPGRVTRWENFVTCHIDNPLFEKGLNLGGEFAMLNEFSLVKRVSTTKSIERLPSFGRKQFWQ